MLRRSRRIAITFDDGPGPDTPAILDALEAHSAVATFFVLGSRIEGRQHVLRRIASIGCEVANHGYSHRRFGELAADELVAELRSTSDEIERAIGVRPRLVRPPYGKDSNCLLPVASSQELTTALYTVSVHDWDGKDAASIAGQVIRAARRDSVVLLHDAGPAHASRQQTVDALPEILERLATDGYSLVTLSELLQASRRARREVVPRERGAIARRLAPLRARARAARRNVG